MLRLASILLLNFKYNYPNIIIQYIVSVFQDKPKNKSLVAFFWENLKAKLLASYKESMNDVHLESGFIYIYNK